MQAKRGTLSSLLKSPHGTEPYDSALERDYMVELEHDPAVKEWTKRHGVTIPYRFLEPVSKVPETCRFEIWLPCLDIC